MKEAKERLAMVPKKDLKRLKRELSVIVSDKKTIEKMIEELDNLRDGSLSPEANEFKSLVAATDRAKSVVKNLTTEEELGSSKKEIKSIIDGMQALRKRLAEFEENFRKYNIPKLSDSTLDFMYKFQEFMKIWKQEVKMGREKGEKSLIEWLKQLGQSNQERRKIALEEMKHVVIELGIQISHSLIEYILLMAVVLSDRHVLTRKLSDVMVMIGFLSLEENSIVIKRFLSVVKFVEIKMKESENCSTVRVSYVPYSMREIELLQLILREVLRLEVALCCPDLPMMLTDDVYLSMGSHLLKVFEPKPEKVNDKMNELKMGKLSIRDRDQDLKACNVLKEKLDMGIKKIWNSLDLQSNQDSVPSFKFRNNFLLV